MTSIKIIRAIKIRRALPYLPQIQSMENGNTRSIRAEACLVFGQIWEVSVKRRLFCLAAQTKYVFYQTKKMALIPPCLIMRGIVRIQLRQELMPMLRQEVATRHFLQLLNMPC